MSKLIALRSSTDEILSNAFRSDFSILKQQVLLFDEIGIYKLSNFHRALESILGSLEKVPEFQNIVSTIISELEYLQQKGIIFEVNIEEELSNPQFRLFGQKFEDAKNLLRKVFDLKNAEENKSQVELIKEQRVAVLRLISAVMETTRGAEVVTTFPYTEYTRELIDSNKSNVAQIVISKLPLPNNETPWEQIIDYRSDSRNQTNLLNLRRWIRKMSAESASPIEIAEEIEWLMSEFQNHMKLHKLKANTEALEVMVKAPLEIIENLIRLKFSKIPEPFFALKKRQINLMEAELNAPGREISYIIKTRETFQTQE